MTAGESGSIGTVSLSSASAISRIGVQAKESNSFISMHHQARRRWKKERRDKGEDPALTHDILAFTVSRFGVK